MQEVLSNEYDYGARFYDPVIGRRSVVDPLAEKYYEISPYNYTDNNPAANVDPNGMEIFYGADAQALFGYFQHREQSIYDHFGPGKGKKGGKFGESGASSAEKVLDDNWFMELLAGREVRNAGNALDAYDQGD